MPVLRILSWNILHGGGSRVEQVIAAISEATPDIVVLQEFRHGRHGQMITQALSAAGLEEIYAPATDNARQNTLVVASRYPMQCEIFPDNAVRPARAVSAAVEVSAAFSFNILALHLPQKQAQIPYFTSMLELPRTWLAGHSLLLGDLNCGIPFEDSETKTFYATHLFQQLLHLGWRDAWRKRHPDAREFSWVSTRKQNGFRYDHALVSPLADEIIKSVSYNHVVREKKLSDHSSLHLVLEW
jgi:exodeoxyribonuclease-3